MNRSDYISGNIDKPSYVMVGQVWLKIERDKYWNKDVYQLLKIVDGPCAGLDGTICVKYSTNGGLSWTSAMPFTKKAILTMGWSLYS